MSSASLSLCTAVEELQTPVLESVKRSQSCSNSLSIRPSPSPSVMAPFSHDSAESSASAFFRGSLAVESPPPCATTSVSSSQYLLRSFSGTLQDAEDLLRNLALTMPMSALLSSDSPHHRPSKSISHTSYSAQRATTNVTMPHVRLFQPEENSHATGGFVCDAGADYGSTADSEEEKVPLIPSTSVRSSRRGKTIIAEAIEQQEALEQQLGSTNLEDWQHALAERNAVMSQRVEAAESEGTPACGSSCEHFLSSNYST